MAPVVIPEIFCLGGRTWTVRRVPDLRDDDGNACYGISDGGKCEILLDEHLKGEVELHTFYHELVHALCYTLGWRKLNKEDEKVDALGNLLMQFATTQE